LVQDSFAALRYDHDDQQNPNPEHDERERDGQNLPGNS
jgi:hypothetical protein